MPTIKDKIFFNYDGQWSDEFGLININLDNSMYEEVFIANRDILEIETRGNEKPLFQGFKNYPIEFEMTIAFTEGFTDEKVQEIVEWMFPKYYKPLYFENREDRIFYCMPVGDSRIIHNGLKEGYFTITMRCNSPYAYSPIEVSDIYDLSNGVSQTIELFNEGYGDLYPEISIEKLGSGVVSFTNISNSGANWQIANLNNNEKVYIDCEKEIIKSDMENIGVYHYLDASGAFPKLIYGRNVIVISGRCKVQFRYRYKYRF